MMITPDELKTFCATANQRKEHQRSAREIETSLAVFAQKSVQVLRLIFLRHIAPIKSLKRQVNLLLHDLNRFLQVFPDKISPENRVTLYEVLPSPFECFQIYLAAHTITHLYYVKPGLR